jgi:hypothetical protein
MGNANADGSPYGPANVLTANGWCAGSGDPLEGN